MESLWFPLNVELRVNMPMTYEFYDIRCQFWSTAEHPHIYPEFVHQLHWKLYADLQERAGGGVA